MLRSILRAGALAGLVALASCGDVLGPRDELAAARERWASRGYASYRFTFAQNCFCLYEVTRPVVVTVTNGTVTAVHYVSDGTAVAPQYMQYFPTVGDLFATVENAIDERAEHLDVDYHRALGYPTRIDVDYRRQAADDEFTYRASDLQPR